MGIILDNSKLLIRFDDNLWYLTFLGLEPEYSWDNFVSTMVAVDLVMNMKDKRVLLIQQRSSKTSTIQVQMYDNMQITVYVSLYLRIWQENISIRRQVKSSCLLKTDGGKHVAHVYLMILSIMTKLYAVTAHWSKLIMVL